MIGLGARVRHKYSLVSGVVTARTERISGIIQYGVQSDEVQSGVPVALQWFDAADVELFDPSATQGHFI